ncbi:Hypothetical predicted protein [Paramuricea clavata]|uniref:Uncharacterized protein n=1 Tax=Paramuricea clavata TaxID=317549 RepID=A0A7D9J7R2_PARCT|nr:Hypothetical predicted protein [Paramuricea clavata]
MLNVEHSWKRRRLMVDEDSEENGSLYDGMSLTNANASWRKLMRLMARAFPQRFAPGAPVFSQHHRVSLGTPDLNKHHRLSLGNPDLNEHYKFTQSSPDLVEHRRLFLGTPD